jgi:hypothetical protein
MRGPSSMAANLWRHMVREAESTPKVALHPFHI